MKKQAFIIGIIGVFLLIQPMSAQTWEATKRITWNSGSSYHPAIATDSNNHIHVVWHDDTPGNYEIYYKNSTDGGGTWSKAKRLTWNSGDSQYPAIAIDTNNYIYVVWSDNTPGNAEIYYRKSTNGGATWSAKRLTWSSGSSYHPAIAIGQSDSIHIIYYDVTPGNAEIYYKKSTNGGSTWTTKRLTWNGGFSSKSAIAVGSNYHIHVVWEDSSPGNAEIFYKKSTDGGTTWTTKRFTYNSGSSSRPAIATDSSNNISVVWHDNSPGNTEIYYKKSTDGGVNWGGSKRITWNSDHSRHAAIAVDSNNNIHIVWSNGPSGNVSLYYKKSTNGGVTWSTKRLSWSYASYPDISTDSNNNIHVVWEGPSNVAIYYKKGVQ